MPKLALRRRKRVKLCEGQLPLFVEQNFDSRVLLVGLFDFAKGIPCGASHISATKICRIDSSDGTSASGRVDPATAQVISTYADGLKKLNPTTDIESLPSQVALLEAETAKVAEQLKNGELPFEDFEDFVINGNIAESIDGASFVIRGMEPGYSGGANNTHEQHIEVLASDIAASKLVNSGVITDGRAVHLITNSKTEISAWDKSALTDELGESGNKQRFSKKYQSLIEAQDPLSRTFKTDISAYMSNASTTVDQLIVRGVHTGDTKMYDILRSQSDPRYSKAPVNRDAFTREYGPKRDQAFLGALTKNAQTNPNFRGGMATPGGGTGKGSTEKWDAYLRLAEQHQQGGGKVFSTAYSASSSKSSGVQSNAKGVNNVETLAFEFDGGKNGKKYFVATRMSANTNGTRPGTMKDVFQTTESAARAGKLQSWTGKAPSQPRSSTPSAKPAVAPVPTTQKRNTQSKAQQRAQITNLLAGQGRSQREINEALKNAGL